MPEGKGDLTPAETHKRALRALGVRKEEQRLQREQVQAGEASLKAWEARKRVEQITVQTGQEHPRGKGLLDGVRLAIASVSLALTLNACEPAIAPTPMPGGVIEQVGSNIEDVRSELARREAEREVRNHISGSGISQKEINAAITMREGEVVGFQFHTTRETFNSYKAFYNYDFEIPFELGDLSYLERIDVSGFCLGGKIPPELGNLPRLKFLRIMGPVRGKIPSELGGLEELEYFEIIGDGQDYPKFTGTIPPELGNLTKVKKIFIQGIGLSGQIPPELGNLDEIESLVIHTNGLTGQVPPELGKLKRLKELAIISSRNVTGSIPPGLESLELLDIGATGISDIDASCLQHLKLLCIEGSALEKNLGKAGVVALMKSYPGLLVTSKFVN